MTKRKEIREGIAKIVFNARQPDSDFECLYKHQQEAWRCVADKLLSYLHSQGVVIKVDRELPKCHECGGKKFVYGEPENWKTLRLCPTCYGMGGYVAVEPLI